MSFICFVITFQSACKVYSVAYNCIFHTFFRADVADIDMEQLLDLCDALDHNFLDDIQLQRGMKSRLCPREIHIDLNLDGLTDEKVASVRAAALLADKSELFCQTKEYESL